jgi:hypothetical protein
VAGKRAPLRLVLIADVHDERRLSGFIDEIEADRRWFPRLPCGGITPEAGVEDRFNEKLTGCHMIRVPVRPMRHGHHARAGPPNQLGGHADVREIAADAAIG